MATDKKRFLISRTYSITTPESAEIGDFAECGHVFDRTPMSLEEVITELEGCIELSAGPIRSSSDLRGWEWANTEHHTDWRTGNERMESVHIRGLDGEATRQLYRIFRLAKLV